MYFYQQIRFIKCTLSRGGRVPVVAKTQAKVDLIALFNILEIIKSRQFLWGDKQRTSLVKV